MGHRSEGELESVPADDDDSGRGGPTSQPPAVTKPGWASDVRRRIPAPASWPRTLVALGVAAALVVALVAVLDRSATSRPAPTVSGLNGRTVVLQSQVVSVLGDKIMARSIVRPNDGVGRLGVIRLGPGAAEPIAVTGTTVLVQGSDLSDAPSTERTGTWAYPTSGSRRQVYLGASTDFRPSYDTRRAWLTDGTTGREVNVSDGTTVGGPYPLDGRLVAAVGRGLVLQRGDQVVCWNPNGGTGDTVVIGQGSALGGQFEYVLWQSPEGRLIITDPNTRHAWPTAVIVPSAGRSLGPAVMSPSRFRVAVADGKTIHIGDGIVGSSALTVAVVGPVGDLAWLDDNTMVATVGHAGLVVIDGATGQFVTEPDFGFESQGVAVLNPAHK